MQKGFIFALLLISVFVIFSGCTQPPYCGDGVCNGNETSITCPADCGVVIQYGNLNVIVTDSNTSNPISGATVNVWDNPAGDGQINIGAEPLFSYKTDDQGIAYFKLKADNNYAVGVTADSYDPNVFYRVVKLATGESQKIYFALTPLPPKFMCPGTTGTQELAINQDVNVIGGTNYAGKTLRIEFKTLLMNGNGQYGSAVFDLLPQEDNFNVIKSVTVAPNSDLQAAFGTGLVGQQINYIRDCWISGNDLPRAIITNPINGVCGTAAKNYDLNEPFPAGSYCSEGAPFPINPSNPPIGGSSTWVCLSKNGGTDTNCIAIRYGDANIAIGTAVRSFFPSSYTPGVPVIVSIDASPFIGTTSYEVIENFPVGWAITDVNCFVPATKKFCSTTDFAVRTSSIEWVFPDGQLRFLSYNATPPAVTTGVKTFTGKVQDLTHTTMSEFNITGTSSIPHS